MPNVPDFATTSHDALLKTVDSVVDAVTDGAPGSQAVVDQVTATANELLTLSQDVQDEVIAALKSNA